MKVWGANWAFTPNSSSLSGLKRGKDHGPESIAERPVEHGSNTSVQYVLHKDILRVLDSHYIVISRMKHKDRQKQSEERGKVSLDESIETT
jgi:hypothetical protein